MRWIMKAEHFLLVGNPGELLFFLLVPAPVRLVFTPDIGRYLTSVTSAKCLCCVCSTYPK